MRENEKARVFLQPNRTFNLETSAEFTTSIPVTSSHNFNRPVDVRLRPAKSADAAILRAWETAPHLAGLLGDDDWEWETALAEPRSAHRPFIAEVDGRPVGFLEILDPSLDPERYWGDLPPGFRAIDLWIGEAEFLGKGVGRAMMRLALEICFADPDVQTVLVDPLASNTHAHRFYKRCGFTLQERRRFGPDDCIVFRIDRASWEDIR